MTTDHVIQDTWSFDEQVADVFDDMLARSIPGYREMRRVVREFGLRYLGERGVVVDLGTSRGEAVASLLAVRPEATALAVELSAPMAAAARERLQGWSRASVIELDLRRGFPEITRVDVVLSVLTLQFVPIEHRYRILSSARNALADDGALLLVEKVLGSTPTTDACLVETYLDRKREHGYSEEEIARKRLALEGVLVPVTAHENERMLQVAGFGHVERVWQTLNFAGWLALP